MCACGVRGCSVTSGVGLKGLRVVERRAMLLRGLMKGAELGREYAVRE